MLNFSKHNKSVPEKFQLNKFCALGFRREQHTGATFQVVRQSHERPQKKQQHTNVSCECWWCCGNTWDTRSTHSINDYAFHLFILGELRLISMDVANGRYMRIFHSFIFRLRSNTVRLEAWKLLYCRSCTIGYSRKEQRNSILCLPSSNLFEWSLCICGDTYLESFGNRLNWIRFNSECGRPVFTNKTFRKKKPQILNTQNGWSTVAIRSVWNETKKM